jgi:CRISPR-associated protein Csh1
LNNQRCFVRIANTEHFIIPTFLKYEGKDVKFEMDNIQKMSEWVFATKQIENFSVGIENEATGDLFWINYIAYASDGNSVKVINHIKDISSTWFYNIVKKDIEQSNLMSKYFNSKRFNLSTIYYSIPIRKDHEEKNDALKLSSQILEQRKVSLQKLFNHFTELILCHYYKRYRSYSNITSQLERFDFAIRDSVIKYQFLINLFKSLKLTDMEENEKITPENIQSPDKLTQFFEDMGYSPQQQSMYWLGRIVWRIGKAQSEKDHKQMPVLNKINYNGMDFSKIQRLFIDTFELATQYRIAGEIKFYSNMFQQNFPGEIDLWKITPQEAVFYLLSGFTLYINNNEKQ